MFHISLMKSNVRECYSIVNAWIVLHILGNYFYTVLIIFIYLFMVLTKWNKKCTVVIQKKILKPLFFLILFICDKM